MKYVIIGNSTAGIGAVEGIRQIDASGEITVVTNEPHHTYSRPLISYLLLGKVTEETIKYRPDSFYEDNNCTLIHANAVKIDAKAKEVHLEPISGSRPPTPGAPPSKLPYDKLLIAAGSSPFVPHFEGLDTVGEKHTFMNLDDARLLDKALSPGKSVLIVGAGLIGLKCAEGILDKVKHIAVLDLAPRILPSILDAGGSKVVQEYLESKGGIEFLLPESVKRFDGNTALLESGVKTHFDILVLAVGVRPNTALAAGIAEIDKGIIVDEKSQTGAKDIYAAGDCTQAIDISSGQSRIMALLPNAYMQGECAGINMAGGDKAFEKAIPMNAIGFRCAGSPALHVITAGNYTGEEYCETGTGKYKRLFYGDNRLNGYILVGDVDKAGIYTSLIRERTPLDSIDFGLICEKPGLIAFSKEERKIKLGGMA